MIEVIDHDLHTPVSSCDLELWRLDAPGNENWTAGDQLQAKARTTGKGEARIKDLPPGAYRVICADAAQGSEDPPPFQVVDSTTRICIEVAMPAPVPTFVKVYDEHGRLIETARRSTAREMRKVHADPPEWMRPRQRRNDQNEIGLGGGVGGGFTRPWGIRSDWRGFDLKGIQANTRRSTYRSRVFLYFRSRASVIVIASGEPAAERTYAAVALPQAWFLRSVRLPDDRTAEEAGKSLVVRVLAVEANDYDALLRQSCKVTIHCPDFKDLEFDWCPAEELPPLVLEPAE